MTQDPTPRTDPSNDREPHRAVEHGSSGRPRRFGRRTPRDASTRPLAHRLRRTDYLLLAVVGLGLAITVVMAIVDPAA